MLNRGSVVYLTLLSVFVLLGAEQVSAQLVKTALPPPPQSENKSSRIARTKALEPKKLPFWDDFSFSNGIYPQDTLWENSKAVWITRGIGLNTPSIYVATFDGLNEKGNPYNPDVLANGYRDTLTSRPIRLDLVPPGIEGRPRTYLSFYYQWQGNGEAPENEDYLQLDYKDEDGVWVEQFRIYPRATIDRTVFYDTIVAIGADKFFHENFQFRFIAYGRNSGPYDTWNLDYVYLNYNRSTSPVTHPDRALASELSSMFKDYRSIPLTHFKGNAEFQKVNVDVMNLSLGPDVVDFTILGYFRNRFADSSYVDTDNVILSDSIDFTINEMQRTALKFAAFPDTTDTQLFDPNAVAVDIRLKAVFNSEDDNDNTALANDNVIRFHNDTISSYHYLRDFYAYDDGVPEHAVYLTRPNNIAVVEYNMVTDDDDFLKGIDIYFPSYGITSTQTLDFVVYFPDGTGQQPAEQSRLTLTSTRMKKDTVTGFSRIEFQPTIQVPKKFYIGWVAPALGKPMVGFDASHDAGEKIYTRINGVWYQNDDNHHGSIMIRPVFGEGDPVTGIDEQDNTMALYPNPNRGEFFVTGRYDQLSISNVTGQSIPFEKERQGDRTKVTFHSSPGLYLLRIKNGSRIKTEKFILVP